VSIDRKPEHLRIEPWEQSFMKLLHELIPSPRAGKRFINIYRLLRATVGGRERSAFVGGAEQGGEHRCALLLLAILTGYPAEGTQMLRALLERERSETWWSFVEALQRAKLPASAENQTTATNAHDGSVRSLCPERASDAVQAERWKGLFDRLERIRPNLQDQPCAGFVKWAPRVARYSFQSGRVLLQAP
jgi:hypothetical protein